MPHGYTPTFTKITCSKAITSELASAKCGWLIVPQDRQHPKTGPKVHLAVTIAPPLDGAPTGTSPTIDINQADSLVNSPARDRSELIELVPRGTAPDTPSMTCPEVDAEQHRELTLPYNDPTSDPAQVAAYSACRARLVKSGIDPGSYTYDDAADDVIDLMAVLRIGQADLVTSDYYSHVAYGVLEKAPGSVRTLTLDNPEPPGEGQLSDPAADLSSSFQRYIRLCDADPNCKTQFPDLGTTYQTQQSHFASTPVIAQTQGLDPNVSILLDGDRIAQALQGGLASSFEYPLVAAGIAQVPEGLIATLVYNDNGVGPPANPWALFQSQECSYDLHTVSASASLSVQALSAFAGVAMDQPLEKTLCKTWKSAPLPDFYFDGVASLVPTLIVRGSLSPYGDDTFPNMAKQSLQSATIGLFPTLDENALKTGPPCLNVLRRQFLADPSAHLNMAKCTAQSPPIDFVDTP